MTKPRTLILHVPKTGGTSLFTMLNTHGIVYNPKGGDVGRAQFVQGFAQHPIQLGHFIYRPWMAEECDTIFTLLRDPVDRVVSLYKHARRHGTHALHAHAQGAFDAFLEVGAAETSNWVVRQLAKEGAPGRLTLADYSLAQLHLRTFTRVFAGPIGQNLQDCYRACVHGYDLDGWAGRSPHARPSSLQEAVTLTLEQRRRVRALNLLDIALWQEHSR